LPSYTIGDTVNSNFAITPIIGDMDTIDNAGIIVDTVRSSFDPNFVDVAPDGCISSAPTNLQYTIGFENTGNDTAFNIYILDTLAASLDPSTFKVVGASAYMNLTKIKSGAQTILKFDFPGIMLLDSSHHDLCNGVIIYNISSRAGLADGTQVGNRAGIYFDTNPVVMTNTSMNTINCPVIPVLTPITSVSIYPSPATNELFIISDQNAYQSFFITNQLSQVLIQDEIKGTQSKVNISSLPTGVYFAILKGSKGKVVKKFVKI
jgi:uncharacterized repeat protein (TIGR01451 family)